MKRLIVFAGVLALAATAALVGSFGSANGSTPQIPKNISGVVPIIGKQVGNAGLPLVYHGGPVMTTNKTYTIFWIPNGYSVSGNYISTINQYFADVAHDSGMGSNVYAAATQYSGIQYSSSVGGTTTATNAFPTSGCPVYTGVTDCLTDAQLQAEIDTVINAQGWTRNGTNMFFLFTPQNVGSCFDSGGSQCTYTTYCAYHGTTNSGAIYANMPYTVSSTYPGNCDEHQYPNASDADPTLNVTSHEHNEAITDPQLNAWYDSSGAENGDKCAWNFGALQGSNGSEYNQTINGHHYFLQMEWSNTNPNLACVQTYSLGGGGGGSVPKITFLFPLSGTVGTNVTLTGQHFTGTTSVKLGGKAETFRVNSDTSITARIVLGTPKGSFPFQVTNAAGTGTSSVKFTSR